MGIYLFAELIITADAKQLKLALDMYDIVKKEMDR